MLEVFQRERGVPPHAAHKGAAQDGEVEDSYKDGEGGRYYSKQSGRDPCNCEGGPSAAIHGASSQSLCFGVQVPARPVDSHSAGKKAHVEHCGPCKVRVAGELHIDA